MINVKGRFLSILGEVAVFTAIVRTDNNKLSEP